MLINNQLPLGEYRHNYVRLGLLLGALLLFIIHLIVNLLFERGNNQVFPNTTYYVEELAINDVLPSVWVYRILNFLNNVWQLSWLLYTLSFIYRRSATGYLYVTPNTFTTKFYVSFILGFLIQTIWLLFFYQKYIIWTWIVYLISFGFLLFALLILINNLAFNRKLYETEGFIRDIWYLKFFAQNGVAFFACWTAIRFTLAFNTFLQFQFLVSIANAGTITLVLAAVIACAFIFGPNIYAELNDKCAYQFSPWIVLIFFFWGVVDNNWVPKNATRNNIIATIELVATIVSGVVALALFIMRYRASKVDPIA